MCGGVECEHASKNITVRSGHSLTPQQMCLNLMTDPDPRWIQMSPSSPDPDHIHVGPQRRGEQAGDVGGRGAGMNDVKGNDICTLSADADGTGTGRGRQRHQAIVHVAAIAHITEVL